MCDVIECFTWGTHSIFPSFCIPFYCLKSPHEGISPRLPHCTDAVSVIAPLPLSQILRPSEVT